MGSGASGNGRFVLPYGSGEMTFTLPADWQVREVPFRPYPKVAQPEGAVQEALAHPIVSPPLREVVKPGEKVCILVNDSTRKARTELFLPLVLDELNRGGVADADVFLVFATGSHRRVTPDEMEALAGPRVAGRVAMYSHDCHDDAMLTFLGHTSRRTPVFINTRVVQADRRILTGSVVFHWFAGFGGGRKVMVPGVAGYETSRRNHALLLAPGARIGVLDGNPVHEDLLEATRMVGADFLLNTVLEPDGDLLGVFAGELEAAHRAACDLARQAFGVYAGPEKADVVIASCGGWPKDINVYQAHKALENAAAICRQGGVLVLVAECREGIGSEKYWEWVEKYGSLAELERAIRERFELGGHKAWAVARLTSGWRVILLSSLPREVAQRLGFLPAGSPAEAMALAEDMLTQASRTGGTAADRPKVNAVIMPQAALTVPLASACL